ncbi:hypothetical protein MG293_002180 [Ovis ammon polii]|uniref:Uncharacterized protein n=1 Tax=Ovis ammon polii TaxID=230172 RepID=A0AAD4YG88_OVIAM|nr:hypothetical protein MG293_002180 [Ovis ammon polii]
MQRSESEFCPSVILLASLAFRFLSSFKRWKVKDVVKVDGCGSCWLLCRAYFWFLDLEDAHGFEGSAECALAYERLTSATKQTKENESIHHKTLLPSRVLELIFNQQEPEEGLTQCDIEDHWLILAFPPALCSPSVSLEDEGLMTQLCQVRPLRATVLQSWKQPCSLMDLCLCL